MTAENWAQLVTVLLAAAAVAAAPAWTRAGRRIWAPLLLVLLVAAGVVAAWPEQVETGSRAASAVLTLAGGALACLGGGPVTTRLFDLVDTQEGPARRPSLEAAGAVLRGGTWIGVLERLAVFATLLAGWAEGLAVVLALKGLGRYPELRAAEDGVRTGAAERFIIGTFASVLWAAGCAGVVLLVRQH